MIFCGSLAHRTCRRFTDSDYAIFVWRHASPSPTEPPPTIVLHLHDPNIPLPEPPEYQNPSFYPFASRSLLAVPSAQDGGARSVRSTKSKKSAKSGRRKGESVDGEGSEASGSGPPKFVVDFHRFHSENGVRTVKGSIGPANDGENPLLLFSLEPCRVRSHFNSIQ
jgi:hypothetical protein